MGWSSARGARRAAASSGRGFRERPHLLDRGDRLGGDDLAPADALDLEGLDLHGGVLHGAGARGAAVVDGVAQMEAQAVGVEPGDAPVPLVDARLADGGTDATRLRRRDDAGAVRAVLVLVRGAEDAPGPLALVLVADRPGGAEILADVEVHAGFTRRLRPSSREAADL